MSNIVQVTQEVSYQAVIEKMFEGLTKKAACEACGVVVRTFDRWIATNPNLVQQIREQQTSQFANYTDEIQSNRRENLESLLAFSKTLREGLRVDSILDMREAMQAMSALLKLERQLERTMAGILPPTALIEAPPDDSMSAERAAELLAKLSGANLTKVTVTRTIEVSGPQVVEGIVTSP